MTYYVVIHEFESWEAAKAFADHSSATIRENPVLFQSLSGIGLREVDA